MSWYRAPLWDLRPDITSCRNVAVWNFRSCFYGGPLWREDGSAICSVITQWPEWRRTRNHTLLSHLRLPQPGGPSSRIYIPQENGGPFIPPGTARPYSNSYISTCHLAGPRRGSREIRNKKIKVTSQRLELDRNWGDNVCHKSIRCLYTLAAVIWHACPMIEVSSFLGTQQSRCLLPLM
jgi:hypothetical protein